MDIVEVLSCIKD
jgi:hypothetical protein